MMGWGSGMGLWGGWFLAGLICLLLVGGLIALGLVAFAALSRSSGQRPKEDGHLLASRGSKAAEILKERYARGEITKEQYHSMLDDLTSA